MKEVIKEKIVKKQNCRICGVELSGIGIEINLRHHFKTVHPYDKPYKCKICLFQCFMTHDLRQHIKEDHEKVKLKRVKDC